MSYREDELSLQVRLMPEEAKRRITDAYIAAGCNMTAAAAELGYAWRTVYRWVDALDLEPVFKRLRERATKEGWHHTKSRQGGAPEGNTNGRGGLGLKHKRSSRTAA